MDFFISCIERFKALHSEAKELVKIFLNTAHIDWARKFDLCSADQVSCVHLENDPLVVLLELDNI